MTEEINFIIDSAKESMEGSIAHLEKEFLNIRAGKATPQMLGGVFVNFVLGIFIYICLMWAYGEKYLPNENLKDGIWVQDSLATKLGLQTGDKIISVDGEKVKKFSDLSLEFINGNKYEIERNGEVISKEIPEDFISQLMDRGKDAGPFLFPRYPFAIAEISEEYSTNL